MNTYKPLGVVGLAFASLFTASAVAATTCPAGTQGSPVCVATSGGDGSGSSLQEQLDSMAVGGPGVDVYHGQAYPGAFWSIGATSNSENSIALEMAGNATLNTFGIFDPTNSSNYLELFSGSASTGWSTTLRNLGGGHYKASYFDQNGDFQSQTSAHFAATNLVGYYLGTPNGSFFSDPTLNEPGGTTYPNGMPHMLAYAGDGSTTFQTGPTSGKFLSNEFLLAWEDKAFADSDLDYNDFVVLVESVRPVPEPAVLGMFGFGALLIGLFGGLRRRRDNL